MSLNLQHCDKVVASDYGTCLKSDHLALITAEEITLDVDESRGWLVTFDRRPTKVSSSGIADNVLQAMCCQNNFYV